MKKAIVFLADGFEETEAITVIDILRRASVQVTTVSITTEATVKGAHSVPVVADTTIDNCVFEDADAIILPGGMPGASNLEASESVREVLLQQYRKGGFVAAICAAPMVLGSLGLLKGKKATCYPGFEDRMIGATATGADFEVDGNVITGKGPGMAMTFALALVTALRGEAVAEEVASGLLLI
jgi:4-methyl-5(b-hydroxyethyl)-thiazole monophosphate biosynthesis